MKRSRFQVGRYGWQKGFAGWLVSFFARLFLPAQLSSGGKVLAARSQIRTSTNQSL